MVRGEKEDQFGGGIMRIRRFAGVGAEKRLRIEQSLNI